MKVMIILFGLAGGFVAGLLLTGNPIVGGVGAVVGSIILGKLGSSFGEKAVKAEANAVSGPGRSVAKALFWWLVLLAIAAAAIILIGLQAR